MGKSSKFWPNSYRAHLAILPSGWLPSHMYCDALGWYCNPWLASLANVRGLPRGTSSGKVPTSAVPVVRKLLRDLAVKPLRVQPCRWRQHGCKRTSRRAARTKLPRRKRKKNLLQWTHPAFRNVDHPTDRSKDDFLRKQDRIEAVSRHALQ